MTRRLKSAEHTASTARVYVANVGDPRTPDLVARFQFTDADGRTHTVTFPAHLIENLTDDLELARRAFALRAPEELVHPMRRGRSKS